MIDGADPDLIPSRQGSSCPQLWEREACGPSDALVRVTSNSPRLVDVTSTGSGRLSTYSKAYSLCRHVSVPYVSHARWPVVAAAGAAPHLTGPTASRRTTRIAAAFAVWGHNGAEAHGAKDMHAHM